MWREYLDPAFVEYLPEYRFENSPLDLAQRMLTHGPRGGVPVVPRTTVKGEPIQYKITEKFLVEASYKVTDMLEEFKQAASAKGQLENMDESGIHRSIMFPTDAVYLVNHEGFPAEVSRAFASAYNRWLKDFCDQSPERLIPLGVVSRHDPATMIDQLETLVSWGWKNILLRPEPILGKGLGDAVYRAFWQACEHHQVSVSIKGGSHLHGPTIGLDRFESHFAIHACSHYMEAQLAFLSLLEGGVFEKYPTLRFAFMEAGASWLPAWLFRLDKVCYDVLPKEVEGRINQKPSEYFRRQCWIAFEIDEPGLGEVVKAVGIDRLLWGTDFPHMDHDFVKVSDLESEDFTPTEFRQILEENPKGFYRF